MSLDLTRLPNPPQGPHTYAQLLTGLSANGIAGAVARGELVRVLPDAYSPAVHAESFTVRMRAAARWSPKGGAVTGRAALHQWQILDAPRDVGLVVPRGRHRRMAPWLWVTSQTHPYDRIPLADGVDVVDPELALVHAFAREPERSRADLVYRACAGGADAARALDLLRELPRVRVRRDLVRLLNHAARGVESYLEEKAVTTVFTGPDFAGLILQHAVRVDGRLFRLDAYDPATMTAFECDGEGAHSSIAGVRRDRQRDALLATLGIATVRFSYADVTQRPEWCRDVARRVLAERRRRAS